MAAYTTIDDPSAHFNTITYTFASTPDNRVFTFDGNSDLQPDFIWLKRRDTTTYHILQDSSRGVTKFINSNATSAEDTYSNYLKSFNTNGLTIGGGDSASNQGSGGTGVIWAWKAGGGTTASNTSGSITSTVQANTDAGFSIVTYTGTGANATVGHGLGVIPDLVIYKNRTDSGTGGGTNANWIVQSSQNEVDQYMKLNTTDAAATDTGYFRGVRPSSTVLTLGNYNSNNGSNDNLIAYAFASKQGYSKFGSYKGNGSGTSDGTFDGVFVYLGFKPAWLMIKRTSYSGGDGWEMFDNTRSSRGTIDASNYINNKLGAQSTSAESGNVYDAVDFLSNGFKARTGRAGINSGSTYTYYAFAENPFVTSTGTPTTAR